MLLSDTQNPFFAHKTDPITKEKKADFSTRKFRQFVEESLNKVPISKKIFKSSKIFRNKKSIINHFSS